MGFAVTMTQRASAILVRLMLLCCVSALFVLDVSDAHAQSRNCQALANTLASIERSGDFGDLGDVRRRTRELEREVQRAESKYVRDGCNAAAKRGERLTTACRTQARAVIRAREALEAASSQQETGAAIAQQREAILQEMARFNCSSRSSAGVTERSRGNLFDQLFGGFGADRFEFAALAESTAAARDTIGDFSRSQADRIVLTGIDANTTASGNQAFIFKGLTGFTHQAGELIYGFSGTTTIISGDVNGDGIADFSVRMSNKVSLIASDFLL